MLNKKILLPFSRFIFIIRDKKSNIGLNIIFYSLVRRATDVEVNIIFVRVLH